MKDKRKVSKSNNNHNHNHNNNNNYSLIHVAGFWAQLRSNATSSQSSLADAGGTQAEPGDLPLEKGQMN